MFHGRIDIGKKRKDCNRDQRRNKGEKRIQHVKEAQGQDQRSQVSAYLEIKIRDSDSRVEILSKVHKHLKAGEKQESEAQDTKESEVVAATEKEDKGSDGESNAGKLNISFLTVKMRALEINREIEWKKLEIEQEIKEKEMAMKEKEIEKEREMKEKEMEMKRLELEEKEKERQEREKERLHELEVLRLGGQRKTTLTSSFDPYRTGQQPLQSQQEKEKRSSQ
ncbi:arginine and glutamate-rich protein 1-like [Procambarus clarkii]|uniref:arginine and glutamate-rich protein 1-like n=1 Tax=Procambarus clarkii TaxID=6728 RepID=UPI003743DC37